MKNLNKSIVFFYIPGLILGVLIAVALFFSPLVKAQTLQVNDNSRCLPGQLCNPIGSTDLGGFLGKVGDAVLKVGIPIAAIFIIFAGLKFVTAAGDETAIKAAKQIFWYTIIGTAILLGAGVLAKVLEATMRSVAS